ncbi:MAG: DsbA family protein, partial [Alphaproteobacteria bacterium]|nr:DsbA family protein [Alphaproteobacteria bacterium]
AYVNGADINDKGVLAEVASACGLDPTAAVEACSDPEVKAMLKDHVDAGIEAGVFGSPFFIYEGEKFWGYDRMDQLEQWIKRGGW